MAASVTRPGPVVVKIGGALLTNPAALGALWDGVRRLRQETPVIVVHGGGPQATEVARRLGHEPRMVHGRRVTSGLDLQIVQWTLRGELNTALVAGAVARALPAVGLSGVDGALLSVRRRPPWEVDGEVVDFGWVGDVERVNADLLHHLLAGGFLPIVSPLGHDADGHVYNVNADTVALALAEGAGASQLLLVAESGGVKRDVTAADGYLPTVDAATYEQGLAEGWIQGGMRVKLHAAFAALKAGIPNVYVLAPDDLVARAYGTAIVP